MSGYQYIYPHPARSAAPGYRSTTMTINTLTPAATTTDVITSVTVYDRTKPVLEYPPPLEQLSSLFKRSAEWPSADTAELRFNEQDILQTMVRSLSLSL